MFSKVLVANRGEIAIRAFRAAYELGRTDGRRLPPRGPRVRAPAEGRRGLRDRRARPPGPGLPRPRGDRRGRAAGAAPTRSTPATASSRRTPHLAEACANAGITFIGPTADVLDPDRQQGPRDRGREGRRRAHAGLRRAVHRRRRTGRGRRGDRLPAVRQGRRRRRRPRHAPRRRARRRCATRVETCMREAEGAFGDPTVFLEQAVVDPRHIEVQILADGDGQRDPPVRARLLGAAPPPEGRRDRPGAEPRPGAARADVRRRRAVRHGDRLPQRRHRRVPARPATGNYVFIEMNPRIQVEHTVTEEVTDVDLVQAADADRLRRDPRPTSGCPRTPSGCAAPRCSAGSPPRTRPTASAPTPAGSPPTARRAAPASASTAARRTPAPRSAPTSTRCWPSSPAAAATSPTAVDRARRAVAEFRIRGVATNIPFLQAVLDDPDFRAGRLTTVVHRGPPAAAHRRAAPPTAAPSCSTTSPTSPSTSRTAPAPVSRRPGQQAARRSTSTRARPRRHPPAAAARSAPRRSPGRCASRPPSRSPTPPSATRTSRCSRPGCAPATCSRSPATSPG